MGKGLAVVVVVAALVIAGCSARYHAPARYDDLLVLSTRLAKSGMARIDHSYELKRKDDGRLLATAQTTLACLDRDGQIARIPEFIRNA